MAFFDINDSVRVNASFLSYSYPKTTLFNSNGSWKEHLSFTNSKYYYKIPYPLTNDTKLTYLHTGIPSVYKPTTMYIFGLLHNNIDGLTANADKTANAASNIIGELVIEHTSSSTSNKLYLCILLKGVNSTSTSFKTTSIDKIINMILSDPIKQDEYIRSIDLNLDLDIPVVEKCFKYKDKTNTVIILTEPIQLTNQDVSTIISILEPNTKLFSISAPNDYENTTKEETDGLAMDVNVDDVKNDNDIYIDCKPTGHSFKDVATYQIPINSAFSKDMQQMDFMKTSMNFFLFIIGLVFIYLTVPATYKMMVIDKTNLGFGGSSSEVLRKTRIRSADMLFFFGFFSLIFTCFYYGFQENADFQLVINGLFLFVFFGLSFSIIQINKLNKSFMSTGQIELEIKSDDEKSGKPTFTNPVDMFALIGSCFAYAYFFNYNGETMNYSGGATLAMLACEIIVATILIILRYGSHSIDDKDFKKYCWEILGFAIPVGVPLFMFMIT